MLQNGFSKNDKDLMFMCMLVCQIILNSSQGYETISVEELWNFLSNKEDSPHTLDNCNGRGNNCKTMSNLLYADNNIQCSLEKNNWRVCDLNTLENLLQADKSMESIWLFGLTIKNTSTVIIVKDEAKYNSKKNAKMTDKEHEECSTKYRLFVVSSEMFEEAISESQKYHIQLVYTHVFPRDCRMFIAVPVYKDGYINEKDRIHNNF